MLLFMAVCENCLSFICLFVLFFSSFLSPHYVPGPILSSFLSLHLAFSSLYVSCCCCLCIIFFFTFLSLFRPHSLIIISFPPSLFSPFLSFLLFSPSWCPYWQSVVLPFLLRVQSMPGVLMELEMRSVEPGDMKSVIVDEMSILWSAIRSSAEQRQEPFIQPNCSSLAFLKGAGRKWVGCWCFGITVVRQKTCCLYGHKTLHTVSLDIHQNACQQEKMYKTQKGQPF